MKLIRSELLYSSLNYHDVASVNSRTEKIVGEWDRLGQVSQRRKVEIKEALNLLERIDQLHLMFAKRVTPFNSWLEQATEDLQDMFIVHKVEEIAVINWRLLQGHETFKHTLPTAEKELNDMLQDAQAAEQLVREHNLPPELAKNHYTMIDHKTLMNRWQAMQAMIPHRDRELQDELAKQQNHERMRLQFAKLANQFGPWIERNLDAVESVISSRHVPLEQQLKQLSHLEEEVNKGRPTIAELEECNQVLQEASVLQNPNTRYTMDTIRVGWEQLLTNVKRQQSEVQNQILTRDARGVSESQLEECRRCFNHFDKQRNRRLDPLEFRACLVSIGHNVPNNPQGEAEFRRIMTRVDPNNTGYVTFEAFMNFATKQTKDADTMDEFIDSFRTLANDAPYITADTLRRELPADEAEYCIKNMKPVSNGEAGALDYMSFSSRVYGVSDL
ncbi:actinin alpha 2 [Cichlidogyrus casuarinus]|uniref:Actinin alpha 2 n=1 Tax=Cichlidogyrus casuarinus TaxID=1844966 RepID=A0ABD2PRH7_9PLAT